jgi:hypothetical protein
VTIRITSIFYVFLFTYFLFSTFSGYGNTVIQQAGTYGKVLILILSIILIFLNQKSIISLFFKSTTYKIFLMFMLLIIFSAISSYLHSGITKYMFLSFYIILSYLFIMLIILKINTIQKLMKSLEIIILIQFLIGICLIILLNLNIYDYSAGGIGETTGGLSGFLEKRNTFSLLCSIGFLSSFYLYINYKSKKSFCLFIIYLTLIYFTQTRFVYMIIFSFFFFYIYFYFFMRIIDKNIRLFIYLLKIVSIIIFILLVVNMFLTDSKSVNDFATGRIFVWTLFFKECFNDYFSLIFGYGNSYLSDIILEKYSKYYYYLKILDDLSLHSSYLKLIEVSGIIGFLFFIYLNILAFKNADLFSKSVILSFLVGGLVESFLMNPNTVASMFYWFILLLNLKKDK